MQKYTSHIPPEKLFRDHLITVLTFVHAYCFAVKAKLFPDDGFENVLPLKRIEELRNRLLKAGDSGELGMSSNNLLTCYAAYALMNKLLFSHYGFTMYGGIEKEINEGHFLKEFPAFRGHYSRINIHFIDDIEKKFPSLKGLKELKIQIGEFLKQFN